MTQTLILKLRLLQLNLHTLVASLLLLAGVLLWGSLLLNAPEKHLALPVVIQPRIMPVESTDDQHLQQFYATLGERSDVETAVQTLFELAAKNGVSLNAGDYQWNYDKEALLYRYRIRLPVKASYTQIRQLTLAILAELPFAAVDELSFKRDSADDDTLQSTLQVTLYLNDKSQSTGALK